MTKHYTKGELTVVWKPEQCIHSTICWTNLKEVFNPRIRPWINMEGAELARIKEQVAKCPSGALSFMENTTAATEENVETAMNTAVEAVKNGPLMVYGNLTVKDGKGNTITKNKVTAFCRCGASGNKPFCDGSHIKVGFRD